MYMYVIHVYTCTCTCTYRYVDSTVQLCITHLEPVINASNGAFVGCLGTDVLMNSTQEWLRDTFGPSSDRCQTMSQNCDVTVFIVDLSEEGEAWLLATSHGDQELLRSCDDDSWCRVKGSDATVPTIRDAAVWLEAGGWGHRGYTLDVVNHRFVEHSAFNESNIRWRIVVTQPATCADGYVLVQQLQRGSHEYRCESCSPGTTVVWEGRPHSLGRCVECGSGTYKDLLGTHACTPCPVDTYGTAHGATSLADCTPCDAGRTTGDEAAANATALCQCRKGDYYTSPSNVCLPCPMGANCSRKDGARARDLLAQPGFWKAGVDSIVFTECLMGYGPPSRCHPSLAPTGNASFDQAMDQASVLSATARTFRSGESATSTGME